MSEILGNISVAWFAAGVIAPMFTSRGSGIDVLASLLIGIVMTGIFGSASVVLMKGLNV